MNFTSKIEVFFMLFDISLSIFSMISLKQHFEVNILISGVKSSWTFLYGVASSDSLT